MIYHKNVVSSVAMAGRVVRYHTWPMIHPQTVGEHSWRVATIYMQLFGLPRAEVLEYILKHDLGELGAGDTPFYAKRRSPELKEAVNAAEAQGLKDLGLTMPELTKEEFFKFKVCDLLEMYERGHIESNLGNQYGSTVSKNVIEALQTMLSVPQLMVYVDKLWPGREVT